MPVKVAQQKLPKSGRDLGKLIVAKGLKKLPKVQKIAQSGHTDCKIGSSYNCSRRSIGRFSVSAMPMS